MIGCSMVVNLSVHRELETEQIPYGENTAVMKVMSMVAYQNFQLQIPSSCPFELAALINACLENNPDMRPAAQRIVDMLNSIRV